MPCSPNLEDGHARIRTVILDYGEVLCHRPTPEAFERMARVFHIDAADFPAIYARSRGPYDRGDVTPAVHWSKFAQETGVEIDSDLIETLRDWDIEMWSRVNVPMIEWVANLHAAGIKTMLLSNMEPDMVMHVRQHFEWLKNFDFQVFSSEVRLIKPDPAVYQHCLDCLDAPSAETLFIDDREANVQAARALGINAIQFESVEQLRRDLEARWFAVLPSDSAYEVRSHQE